MPRHMTPEQKWELLLQTIADDLTLKVTEVTEDQVCFIASREDSLNDLKTILSGSELLKERILHILSNDEDASEPLVTGSNLQSEFNKKYKNPLDLLKQLFNEDFLKDIGFKESVFNTEDDTDSKVAVIKTVEGTTEARSALEAAKFKMLRCSVPDKETVRQIWDGKISPIDKESECEENTFGKDLISIKDDEGKQLITLNYGKILQVAQAGHYDGSAPIIAITGHKDDKDNNELSIDKNYILRYLYEILNGAIFNENEDGYVPILFEPNSPTLRNCAFNMVIDISGSMAANFREYKAHIKNIIGKITDSVDDWQFTLTIFNHNIISRNFSSLEHTTDQINEFLEQFYPEGITNLYGAMYKSIKEIPLDLHSTVILITDGHDNAAEREPEELLEISSEIQRQNPQFTMYTMGLGESYSINFFNIISKQMGFTHIDLDKIDEIKSFEQYIDSIGKQRVLYQFFIDAAKKYSAQVPAGEIVIGDVIEKEKIEIVKFGKKHHLGVKEKIYELTGTVYDKVNKIIDSGLKAAVEYAKDVTHNTGYFPNIEDPNYLYWGAGSNIPGNFDFSNVCRLNETVTALIGQEADSIGFCQLPLN